MPRFCPNCNAEKLDGFGICWNCNYNFQNHKIMNPDELSTKDPNNLNLECLRGKHTMSYTGDYKFFEGENMGVFGNLFEFFQNKEVFSIFLCTNCGKVELYSPKIFE